MVGHVGRPPADMFVSGGRAEEQFRRWSCDGPACALACAAGTVWRNYFVEVEQGGIISEEGGEGTVQRGQTRDRQFNGLDKIAEILNKAIATKWRAEDHHAGTTPATRLHEDATVTTASDDRDGLLARGPPRDRNLLSVRNGYSSCADPTLLGQILREMSPEDLDHLRGELRLGLQSSTQVTDTVQKHVKNETTKRWETIHEVCPHSVSQIFCSALALGQNLSGNGGEERRHGWEPLARLVLEAAYEATLAAAVLNHVKNFAPGGPTGGGPTGGPTGRGSGKVFLTFLGGGVFGNELEWIVSAMKRALDLYREFDLEVVLVHFHAAGPQVSACRGLEKEFAGVVGV